MMSAFPIASDVVDHSNRSADPGKLLRRSDAQAAQQLSILAFENEGSSLGVSQERRTNDKIRFPVAIEVSPSGNGIAKGITFLLNGARDGKEQKAGLPAEDKEPGLFQAPR